MKKQWSSGEGKRGGGGGGEEEEEEDRAGVKGGDGAG